MKKLFVLLSIAMFQVVSAQTEEKDRPFNFDARFRIHGILPISMGNNYLADANKSLISVGANLSLFELYDFRLVLGVDHILYDATDHYIAADVTRSRNTSFYAIVSYEVPITDKLSVQPYIGGGWDEVYYRRSDNSTNLEDVSIKKQRGNDFRVGMYIDYELSKRFAVFTGVNYVANSYTIHTAKEYESYFGKAQTVQINLGLKMGYSMKDKRKAKAEKRKQEQHANQP